MQSAFTKQQLTNFLKGRGYKFVATVDNIDVYSKDGFPDILIPDLIVVNINTVKSSVLTDSVMFVEFINQI